MGRPVDAETSIALIKETALNPKFPEENKRALLKLGSMANRYDYGEFDRFDTPVGITTNLSMVASAES